MRYIRNLGHITQQRHMPLSSDIAPDDVTISEFLHLHDLETREHKQNRFSNAKARRHSVCGEALIQPRSAEEEKDNCFQRTSSDSAVLENRKAFARNIDSTFPQIAAVRQNSRALSRESDHRTRYVVSLRGPLKTTPLPSEENKMTANVSQEKISTTAQIPWLEWFAT